MAQVPAAPDAGVLAARLEGVQGANVDAVAPAPAQPVVQEPQGANPVQPTQGQLHEAEQAPEVCFLSLWVFACISPPCFLRFLSSFGFCSVLARPTCRVLFHLWSFVLGSHVVFPGGFFVIACSFLVIATCSGFGYTLRLFISFVTRLVLCDFVHCGLFASGVMVFVFLFFSQVCCVCRRVFSFFPTGL